MEALQTALHQLKQALYSHEQWHKDVIRSVVCRLPYDRRDTEGDAHRFCRFGQWYYTTTAGLLQQHPGFAAIEIEHKRMHEFAAKLLLSSEQTGTVEPPEYDGFTNSVDRLRLQLQSLISELEDSLYKLDPLTGAENRIGMLPTLRQDQAQIQRGIHTSSISIIDLDHFKDVNDNHGHVIGDIVLAEIVRHAKSHLRPYDRIFRYGGEEFLIFLPNTDLATARSIVERIRMQLEEQVLTHDGDTPVKVTASFGLAPLESAITIEESIDHADQALYAAKKTGRNRVCTWGVDEAVETP